MIKFLRESIAALKAPAPLLVVWILIGTAIGVGFLQIAEMWGVVLLGVGVFSAFVARRFVGLQGFWAMWHFGTVIPGLGLTISALTSTCASHSRNISLKPGKPLASCDEILASHTSMGVLFLSAALIAIFAPAAIKRREQNTVR